MFVKMIQIEKDKNGDYPVSSYHVWDCADFILHECEFDGEDQVMLKVFDQNGQMMYGNSWEEKWRTSIYVMNNNGKTIDSYEWHGILPPEERKKSKQ